MYPAPGKTAADYEAVRKKIQDRVAADIVAEHGGTEVEEGPALTNPRRRKKKKEAAGEEGMARSDELGSSGGGPGSAGVASGAVENPQRP